MTTKLKLFNGALRALGQTPLASLSEENKSRRLLDAAWDDDAVRYCLAQGFWTFASRTSKFTYTSSVEASFGYRRVFEKPTDWINTARLCSDEFTSEPVLRYRDEGGYWYSDLDDLYIQYISDDAAFGNDLSGWSEPFTKFVRHYLASEICLDLTQDKAECERLEKKVLALRTDARSKDGMNQPTQFFPEGRFVRSRFGGRSSRDRIGNRLIG